MLLEDDILETDEWWNETTEKVVANVQNRHRWLRFDDIRSAAQMGVLKARRMYDPDRGVSLEKFVIMKATFLTIDELRGEGTIVRTGTRKAAKQLLFYPDVYLIRNLDCHLKEQSYKDAGYMEEVEDQEKKIYFWSLIMRSGLPLESIRLLYLVFGRGLKQISVAKKLGLSESAISLRMKKTINTLKNTGWCGREELKDAYV